MAIHSTTINATLGSGETERWVVPTEGVAGVRVNIQGDETPYDVDIGTHFGQPGPGEADPADYTSSLPHGAETFEDTNDHTLATDVVERSIMVEITNNGSTLGHFEGGISRRDFDDQQALGDFLSTVAANATSKRGVAFRDGEAMIDAYRETSQSWNDIEIVRPEDGDDIFAAANKALSAAGQDGTIFFPPGQFVKSNGRAVSTQLTPTTRDQSVYGWGCDVELADNADQELVFVDENGFKLVHMNLRGNRANNNITACLDTADGLDGCLFRDVEAEDAPTGLRFGGVGASIISSAKTAEIGGNVDTAIQIEGATDTDVVNISVADFSDRGVVFQDCSDLTTATITTSSQSGDGADVGINILGTRKSEIRGVVNARGGVSDGVRAEPQDPNGANESVPSGNDYQVTVDGAMDRGVALEDADVEVVNGEVIGEYSGGRTTQVFEVSSPNGVIDNPGHNIDLTGVTCTRITDTNITSQNAGLRISGHVSKMQQTSTITAQGNSILGLTLGVAIPNPAVNTGSNTVTRYEQGSKSATTDQNGQVDIDWSDDYHFTDKPLVTVMLEQAGQWHIDSFTTDGSGRYTGATIQVTDSSGTAVGNNIPVRVKVRGT